MKKIYIDTRDLPHPKPFEMAVKVLRSLDEQNYLYMLNNKKPHPLIDLGREHKLNILSKKDSHNFWHILMCKDATIDLRTYLSPESFNV